MTFALLIPLGLAGIAIFHHLTTLKPDRSRFQSPAKHAVTLSHDETGLTQISHGALERLLHLGLAGELSGGGARLKGIRVRQVGERELNLRLQIRQTRPEGVIDAGLIEHRASQVLYRMTGLKPVEISLEFR